MAKSIFSKGAPQPQPIKAQLEISLFDIPPEAWPDELKCCGGIMFPVQYPAFIHPRLKLPNELKAQMIMDPNAGVIPMFVCPTCGKVRAVKGKLRGEIET